MIMDTINVDQMQYVIQMQKQINDRKTITPEKRIMNNLYFQTGMCEWPLLRKRLKMVTLYKKYVLSSETRSVKEQKLLVSGMIKVICQLLASPHEIKFLFCPRMLRELIVDMDDLNAFFVLGGWVNYIFQKRVLAPNKITEVLFENFAGFECCSGPLIANKAFIYEIQQQPT